MESAKDKIQIVKLFYGGIHIGRRMVLCLFFYVLFWIYCTCFSIGLSYFAMVLVSGRMLYTFDIYEWVSESYKMTNCYMLVRSICILFAPIMTGTNELQKCWFAIPQQCVSEILKVALDNHSPLDLPTFSIPVYLMLPRPWTV